MPVKLTLQEKIELVLIVGENYKTYREAAVLFNERHPENHISHVTVKNVFDKFKTTGSVENKFKKNHDRRVNNAENQLLIMQAVVEVPKTSLKRISQVLPNNIGKSTISKVLRSNKFHPYKPKFLHTLIPRDFISRFNFCVWFQGIIEDDPFFARKILFTDEATFTSNGVVCSQNTRWWSTENPNFHIESRDQYSFKTNVWAGILNNRIIGPYFFRHNLNSETYYQFLSNQIFDILHEIPLNIRSTLWYQHDGAPCHSARIINEYLDTLFNERWIGRYSANPWPARSPDLTPMDYFLWGYLKNMVYSERPFQNIDDLERIITEKMHQIPAGMIQNSVTDFVRRTVVCMERDGGHVEF